VKIDLSKCKTNYALSAIDNSAKILIKQRKVNKSTSQLPLNKFPYCFNNKSVQSPKLLQSQTLMPSQTLMQGQKSMNSQKMQLSHSKNTSPKKIKRTYHVPGKKTIDVKQIFKYSDKISCGFDKVDTFSTGSKKTISKSIEGQREKKDEKLAKRKFIKPNGYYLNNFMIENKKGKNSMLHFKLGVIVKENDELKERTIEKLRANNQLGNKYFTRLSIKSNAVSPVKNLKSQLSTKIVSNTLTRSPSINDTIPNNNLGTFVIRIV
jgi:hypothetical protein